MKLAKIVKHCRIDKPGKFKLADFDPAETFGLPTDIEQVRAILTDGVARLEDMQERLYADGRWAVLIVLQGMDAAGKDGVIKHVMSGINPLGCLVHAYKAPSAEELAHNFLWRIDKYLPERGHIGIFNRSHYEDVLVVRVHQKLSQNEVKRRFEHINNFESELADNKIHILKFFLHISQDEQKKRLQARLDHPRKYWKVSPSDLTERQYWDDYVQAYDDALSQCSTRHAPWYIIPSNHKWYRNLAISEILLDLMEGFNMKYPKPKFDIKKMKVE